LMNHDDEGGLTGANWTSVVHLAKKVQIFLTATARRARGGEEVRR
jgi:hypothetical protein